MGWYNDRFLPKAIDKLLDQPELAELRAQTTEGLSGRVVEVGFGSGLNVPHYPDTVTEVLAVDPAVEGRRLAAERVAASPIPVRYVGLDGQRLPLDDESVDAALCTFTLCSIPDADRALHELARVLRPGGRLHFLEHGLAERPRAQSIQQRLTPLWRHVAGGCHLDREPTGLLEAAGFTVAATRLPLRGPAVFATMTLGTAARPAS